VQLHTTVRVLTWPACDGRGAGHGAQHQTPPQLLHHHVLESHAAVLPHSTSAHQHITLALLPSCAIIPGTMRSGTAHVHVLSALYSTTWHVHLPLAPSLLPTACILALCCIYLLQTHTVRREGSRPRIIAMRFALHNGGPWRRSLRATRVTRIPIRKAGARTLALTIAAPAIVRGAGGGLACTCQASQERFSDGACEPPTWFCTIFSRQGRTSGLRLRGEGETTSARGLCFFHLPRRSDRGPRGEKPHRAAENPPGQW